MVTRVDSGFSFLAKKGQIFRRTALLSSSATPRRKTHFHVKKTFFLKNENLFHFLIFNFVSKMKIYFNFQFSILFQKWKLILFSIFNFVSKMNNDFNFQFSEPWCMITPKTWEAGLPVGESRRIPWEGERPDTPKIYQK